MKWDPDQALEALRVLAWPILRRAYRADCCIAATRLGILALQRFGVLGVPLSVVATAGNRQFMEWSAAPEEHAPAEGAFYIRTDPNAECGPKGYPGHLVITGAVGGRAYLLDLAAPQMHRPQRGVIIPDPVLLRGPEQSAGRAVGIIDTTTGLPEGGVLSYDINRSPRRDYRLAPDWRLVGRPGPAAVLTQLKAAMADRLAPQVFRSRG